MFPRKTRRTNWLFINPTKHNIKFNSTLDLAHQFEYLSPIFFQQKEYSCSCCHYFFFIWKILLGLNTFRQLLAFNLFKFFVFPTLLLFVFFCATLRSRKGNAKRGQSNNPNEYYCEYNDWVCIPFWDDFSF